MRRERSPIDSARKANRQAPAGADGSSTIAELCAESLLWPEKYHQDKDGNPTGSTDDYRHTLVPLLRLYRDTPCKDFHVICLELVRQEMEDQKRADISQLLVGIPAIKHRSRDEVSGRGLRRGRRAADCQPALMRV